MSTNYYALREPISSIRRKDTGAHIKLTIFIKGENSGELTMSPEESIAFLAMLKSDWNIARAGRSLWQLWWGGETGPQLKVIARKFNPKKQIISEYGELLSLEQLQLQVKGVHDDIL